MRELDLHGLLASIVKELKSSIGAKNIVSYHVDAKLPALVSDDSGSLSLSHTIKSVCIVLAEYLINGIIEIEVKSRKQTSQQIVCDIIIMGSGASEENLNSYESINKIQSELQVSLPNIKLNCTKRENKLVIDFSQSFNQRKQLKDDVSSIEGKKILLVEDSQINVVVFSSFLDDWGVNYLVGSNGQEGIDLFKANSFDAILMDIQMPVMDGVTAIQEIRKWDKKIPIIVLSAAAFQKDIDNAIQAGASEFLKKPVSSWDLFVVLASYLDATD